MNGTNIVQGVHAWCNMFFAGAFVLLCVCIDKIESPKDSAIRVISGID
jgi:hypothetical protein